MIETYFVFVPVYYHSPTASFSSVAPYQNLPNLPSG